MAIRSTTALAATPNHALVHDPTVVLFASHGMLVTGPAQEVGARRHELLVPLPQKGKPTRLLVRLQGEPGTYLRHLQTDALTAEADLDQLRIAAPEEEGGLILVGGQAY